MEFIELYNEKADYLDLGGWEFTRNAYLKSQIILGWQLMVASYVSMWASMKAYMLKGVCYTLIQNS